MTEAMKAPIGVDHGGTYPGAAGGATGGGAGCNDVIKGAIDVNLEGVRRKHFCRLRPMWSSSGTMTPLGSGDHHSSG